MTLYFNVYVKTYFRFLLFSFCGLFMVIFSLSIFFKYFHNRIDAEDVMVPMRDGVRLYTKIYKPEKKGSYPVVLTRGYWPGFGKDHEKFVKSGYVYVGQSTRGHGKSEGLEGVGNRFFDDADDGYDTLTWISNQLWCNGKIAMYGKSYWAITQWLVAVLQHPNLAAIIPQNVGADVFHYGYRCNGALTLAMTARGRAYDKNDWDIIDQIGWINYFSHLPLITLYEIVGGANDSGAIKLWKDYVTHANFDNFWQKITIRADGNDGKYKKINIPVYLMDGWYDYYSGEAFNSYLNLKNSDSSKEIRILIDPTDHLNHVVGDRGFGNNARKDEVAVAIRWLDYVVKGFDNGIRNEPPIQIFVMGINQWRFEDEWPLARTQFTKYYFHSNNGKKNGWLSTEPPGKEVPTEYTNDPENPVPTIGGNHSFSDNNIPHIIRAGAVDQRRNEERDDVLVFTSEPVKEDTEVTGPIVIKLFAASSAMDTDFTAKLIDVYPNGTAYNLTEGIIRARFRESIYNPPKLLIPGKIYEYKLELLPTSNVFKEGHSIRVHLTSSNFPLWDRNPNTGHDQGMDTDLEVARQTIHHDQNYPSHIVLPVIP
jgi:hypothetical protein